jgi:hypothetical protein
MKKAFLILAAVFVLVFPSAAQSKADADQPALWWPFESSVITGELTGNYRFVPGSFGNGLKFDGYTTKVTLDAGEAPDMPGGFSIEAWLAPAAHPWNWCGLVTHTDNQSAGYAVEIGPDGEFRMRLYDGETWRECTAAESIPLKKWTHAAAVFRPGEGIILYLNGQPSGKMEFAGNMVSAGAADLLIGTVREKQKPAMIHREHGTLPYWYSLDAIVDEVKIFSNPLDEKIIQKHYTQTRPAVEPGIPQRRLPAGPDGPGKFGAYYTRLQYYWEWDELWRVADDPDVVVRFDSSPVRLVFWRGTRYSPAWVSGNGMWMADQSVEAWNDEEGCFEHMQDRHCRYSHVRILENTPARVVVHWRYAPVSAYNNLWRIDERTGWACWVDEYYYIYPDASGIRKVTWQTGSLGQPRQFQESIPLTHPGQIQGDVVNKDYVTIANLEGETQVFSYIENPPKETTKSIPDNPNIQRHNLKSKEKPFIVFEPGGDMHYLKDMNIDSLSQPASCTHWPVGQMPCDGRSTPAPDRAGSFLGFPITDPVIHTGVDDRSWVASLYGMKDISMEELVMLGRSWARAPRLHVETEGFSCSGFDMSQRAYIVEKMPETAANRLKVQLDGTPESPVNHFCLVVKNWDKPDTELFLNGAPLDSGRGRVGYVRHLDRMDLLIWVEIQSTEPVVLEAAGK